MKAVASSWDSSLSASGSKWKIYDAQSGDVLQTLSTNHGIELIQFSTHGDQLLFTKWDSATIWDLSNSYETDCNRLQPIRKCRLDTSPPLLATRFADEENDVNDQICCIFNRTFTRQNPCYSDFMKIRNTENGYSNTKITPKHITFR
jgi:hypothetical protein